MPQTEKWTCQNERKCGGRERLVFSQERLGSVITKWSRSKSSGL